MNQEEHHEDHEHHDTGLDKLNQMRFIGGLNTLSKLFDEFGFTKWADWFKEDLTDFQEAVKPPISLPRQLAIVEHVFMAFTGMNDFREEKLQKADGSEDVEAHAKMDKFAKQLWAAARGIQAYINFEQTKNQN